MSGSKTIRESRKLLEPLGYELVGWNKNSHLVYRHTATGAIARVVSTFDSNPRARANMVLQAKRSIREVESISRLWLNFVREQYEVGESEEKLCVISMVSLQKRFRARYPGLRFSEKLPGVVFRQSPYVDHVKTGVYIVRGELYGVTPPEAADVPAVEPVREPAAAPVDPAPVEAVAQDAGDVGRVAEAEQSEPRHDPEPVESDRTVVVGGLTLPDVLVKQLRDAIGADGDLEAENALLRETLTQVLGSLQGASEAVQTALSLRQGKQHAQKRRGYRLGTKRTDQLHALRAADLPERVTSTDVERVLGVKYREAIGILWAFGRTGHMERVARGVYRWAR